MRLDDKIICYYYYSFLCNLFWDNKYSDSDSDFYIILKRKLFPWRKGTSATFFMLNGL